MRTQSTSINEIIICYLDGSASLEEKLQLLHWLKESETNWADFNETCALWLSCDADPENEEKIDFALNRLRQRIVNEINQPKPRLRLSIRWHQAVAIFLILIGMGYWLTTQNILSTETYIQNQLITAKGSKGRFTLPDGTIVWLNSDSKLIYPEAFSENKRQVELEGKGYFQVAENKEKPFIVKSGEVDVEVLGTAFDISSYSFMDKIEVVLLNGSVKVTSDSFSSPIVLAPNQLLAYRKDNKSVQIQTTKAHLHIDWTKEMLIFDNMSLSDIIISMEGWYNISIKCPKTFANKTHMSFTVKGENVDEILKAMSRITPINYTIAGHDITIVPK